MEPLRSGDPRRISSYEILNRLGAGGMGQVYLGRSPSGRRVAVKVIRPELTNDATFRARFRREVATMRQVSGFFTAPVVDADPDGDPAWLATAFVPGPSLESAVAENGAMAHQDVLVLAAGLAEALNAIHREGLTHRDLKPGNVLMAEDGPRVIDFGLAVTAESAGLTQAGTVVGTPAFMSPEQVSGQQVGPASDIWSLGAVLAYAATASSPFGEGTTMETMLRVMNGEPDLSGLTGTLAQLVAACMMKDPNARPTPARILQVLSEGAGVQATMAMEIYGRGAGAGAGTASAESEAGVGGDAGSGAADSGAASEGGSSAAGSQPAWPTAEGAAQAVSGTNPVVPSQPSAPAWGTAAETTGPTQNSGSNTAPPPQPAWGTAQTTGPAQNSSPGPSPATPQQPAWGSTGQASGPAPSPATPQQPAWGSTGQASGPTPNPATPQQPAWGSAQATGPAQNSEPASGPSPATPQQPAWGTAQNPGPQSTGPAAQPQPSAPAWGTAPVAGPGPGPAPTPPPPAPSWGGTPGPVSGPSTPPQAMPSVPSAPSMPSTMPSVPSNQWSQPPVHHQPYQGGAPATQAAQAASPWMQPQPSVGYGVPVPPAKKNRNALIAVIGVAAVVVVGGGIALVMSSGGGSGGSGGATGGTTGSTLSLGALTPVAADFKLSGLVTDADAAQYLKAQPTSGTPTDDSTDDPTTYDEQWQVSSSNAELRVQASNYKADSKQASTDFINHVSTLATDAKFEDQGALGNSDKTEIQVATDQSSGMQHCKIEILRGGLDVTVTFVEPGSAASAHTDVLNLAKLVTGRLPGK